VSFKRFDDDLVAGVRGLAALAPAHQGLLRIKIERDDFFACACRHLGERRCEGCFSRAAFLREKCNAAH
jgi:hypothetical protein